MSGVGIRFDETTKCIVVWDSSSSGREHAIWIDPRAFPTLRSCLDKYERGAIACRICKSDKPHEHVLDRKGNCVEG